MKRLIAAFLPGLFLLGYNIGTGSVTTMSKAGAEYGMTLLWTVLLSCVVTFFMMYIFGRYTLASGRTVLISIKEHIHPLVGIYFILSLTIGAAGSVMGVMGIVDEICYEWSKGLVDGGIHPLFWGILFMVATCWLFWAGRTQLFERALALMVAVMSVCFVANFFIMMPPVGDLFSGLLPSLPASEDGSQSGSFLVIAGMVGTTVFCGAYIVRGTLLMEAGWTMADSKKSLYDALMAAVMMFVISAAVMAAAAGTLHPEGVILTSASQMLGLLEPMVGPFAVHLFAFGIVAAGLSSQFPNMVLLPWLLCDYNGWKRDMSLGKFRIMVVLISLLGLVVPLFDAKPVLVIILSQVFNAFVLPATTLCIFYLTNSKKLMGEHRNGPWLNLCLGLVFIFSLVMCYIAVVAIWGRLFS